MKLDVVSQKFPLGYWAQSSKTLVSVSIWTPLTSTNVVFPFTVHGGEVALLLGMPGMKPPPAYVAPPFAFGWLPIIPSILVRTAVQGTAGFQDGSWPGGTVVPWAMYGCTANKAPRPMITTSTNALVTNLVCCGRDIVISSAPVNVVI